VLSAYFIYDTYTTALEASTKGTIPHLPNIEDYLVLPIKAEPHLLSDTSDEDDIDTPRKRRRIDQGGTLPDLEMWEDIELEDVPRLCIERPSPLVCVNQDLASQFS
jgi:DNA polymerase mu